MSLIKSIKNTFRGWSKKAEKSLSDPKRDVQLAIEDSEKQIANAENAIAKVIATNKGVERKIENYERDATKYQSLAKKAKENQDMDNAKIFFQKYQVAKKLAEQSREILKQNQSVVESKRQQVQNWKSNLETAKATKDSFDLRHQMVEATNSINDLNMADKDGNGIPDNLENAFDKLQEEEDILSAKEKMNTDPVLAAEKKYSYSSTDAEFEEFMKS